MSILLRFYFPKYAITEGWVEFCAIKYALVDKNFKGHFQDNRNNLNRNNINSKKEKTEREEITNELIGGNFPEQKDTLDYKVIDKINPYPGH